MSELTADTITDEQIRKLRSSVVFRNTNHVVELCDVALGARCASDPAAYRAARARGVPCCSRPRRRDSQRTERQVIDDAQREMEAAWDSIDDEESAKRRKILDEIEAMLERIRIELAARDFELVESEPDSNQTLGLTLW